MNTLRKTLEAEGSPYHEASEKIKKIIDFYYENKSLPLKAMFSQAPSQTNKCTNKFVHGDIYYQCYQCVVEDPASSRYFFLCSDCFVPSEHEGHFYKSEYVTKEQQKQVFCACGKDLTGEGTINTCQKHTEKQIVCEFIPQQSQEFKKIYTQAYRIYFYLLEKSKEMSISEKNQLMEFLKIYYIGINCLIHSSTSESVKFTRLFTQVLQEHINEEETVLDLLVKYDGFLNDFSESVFLDLLADNSSAIVFYKRISEIIEKGTKVVFQQRLSTELDYVSRWIIDKLDEEQCFLYFLLNPAYSIYCKRTKNFSLIEEILARLIEDEQRDRQQVINIIAAFLHRCGSVFFKPQSQRVLIKFFAGLYSPEQQNQSDNEAVENQANEQVSDNSESMALPVANPRMNGIDLSNSLEDNVREVLNNLNNQENQVVAENNQSEQRESQDQRGEGINSESQNNPQENPNEENLLPVLPNPVDQLISSPILMPNPQLGSSLELSSHERREQEDVIDYPLFSEVIGQRIYAYFRGEKEQLLTARSSLQKQGVEEVLLEQFLNWSIENINFGGSLELIPSRFVICVIFLLNQSPQYKQHVKKFWDSVFTQNDIDHLFKSIWSLFFILTDKKILKWNYKLTVYRECYQTFAYYREQQKQSEKTEIKLKKEEIQQGIGLAQKQFLYEFQEISSSEMGQLREILDHVKFAQILSKYCTYSQQTNKFIYNSTQAYPNKLIILLKAIQNLKVDNNKKFKYFQNPELFDQINNITKPERELREKLFIQSQFLDKLQNVWNSMIRNLGDREDLINYFIETRKIESFLQILVMTRNLCGGKFERIEEYLDKFRTNTDSLNELYLVGRKEAIDHILCINENTAQSPLLVQNILNNEEKQLNDLKKKSKNKKTKIMERWRQKRTNAVKILTAQHNLILEQIADEEQECLICHEKSKPGNEMVYMMDIVKNSTLCSSIFKQKNCASTFLSSCFHSLHLQCFLSTKSNTNRYLRCPLCSKPQNAIFPAIYCQQNKKLNTICENILACAAIITYGVYDVQNWFTTFMEYLVESKGFCSLMQPNKYQQRKKKREKLDRFVEGTLINMYRTADISKKTIFDENIEKFYSKIELCLDEDFRIIQKVILDAIISKIRNGKSSVEEEQILRLSSQIKENDFKILKREICEFGVEILEVENNAPVNSQKQRTISFQPKKLPETWDKLPKLGGQQCMKCSSKQKAIFCLICGQTLCKKCEDSQNHQNKHYKRSLSFLFSESRLNIKTEASSLSADIYYNQLKTSISKFNDSSRPHDVFKLNNEFYEKLNDIFFDDM